MSEFHERDCDNCIFHDGRCTRWDCKCITRDYAEEIIENMKSAVSEIAMRKERMIFEHDLRIEIYAGEYKGLRGALEIITKHTKGGF